LLRSRHRAESRACATRRFFHARCSDLRSDIHRLILEIGTRDSLLSKGAFSHCAPLSKICRLITSVALSLSPFHPRFSDFTSLHTRPGYRRKKNTIFYSDILCMTEHSYIRPSMFHSFVPLSSTSYRPSLSILKFECRS